MREKDIGILKMPPARYVSKKWIDEVTKSTKSRVLNEALITFECYQMSKKNVNYNPLNISGKLMEFSNQIRSDCR